MFRGLLMLSKKLWTQWASSGCGELSLSLSQASLFPLQSEKLSVVLFCLVVRLDESWSATWADFLSSWLRNWKKNISMEHIPPLHDQTWGDNSNAEELVEENYFLGIHLRAKKKKKHFRWWRISPETNDTYTDIRRSMGWFYQKAVKVRSMFEFKDGWWL